jgi:PAS domain S-box-containing protein
MSTVNEAQSSAAHLENRLQFETLISDVSSRFINLPAGEVDREIEDALRRVCETLGVDLAVLWQWSLVSPAVVSPTHVYCARDELRPSEPMRQEQVPWSQEQLLMGRTIAISSLGDIPAEAAVDREFCRLHGIKSVLCLPLSLGGGQPFGALGFNALQAECDWPDTLVTQVQLVAQVFANALDRQRHELLLQRSEARLTAGAELANLAFYQVDYDEGSTYFDDRAFDLFDVPRDLRAGLQALEFWAAHLHPGDRQSVLDTRQRLHSGKVDQVSMEYRYLHPGRGEQWIHHLARIAMRDATGRPVKVFGVLRDITATKRAEEALRDLSGRLIQAHEEERALLARELHDDVTQRLAVLAIEVGRTELAAPAGPHAEAMRSIRAELIRLSEDIHSLAYQLHPSVLEELGLVEALRAECERRTRQGRLDLTADLEPLPAAVGKEAALCLFRVAQEALTNVARHARTRAAIVTLRNMDDGLLLAVRDHGAGFDPERQRERMHLGLASMRERVQLVHGTLDIESAPGRGTAIIAWVPAHSSEEVAR